MRSRLLVAPVAGALAVACGASPPDGRGAPEEGPAARGTRIEVTAEVGAGASTIDVTMCFEGPRPARLEAGAEVGARALVAASFTRAGGEERPIDAHGERIELADVPDDACVRYRLDVAALGRGTATRRGDDVLLANGAWLWRPEPVVSGIEGVAHVRLPDGMRASLPWPRREDGAYELREGTFRLLSRAAFGSFTPHTIEAGGARIEVVRLAGELAMSDADVEAWIRGAAECASGITGFFPVPSAQISVVPIGPQHDPLGFGQATRGGGAGVMLLLPADSTLAEVERDWVTVHEMTHLAFPFIRRADAFLSEGAATYYQEILRARAGVISDLDAWRALDDGFRRGRASGTGRTLADESRDMMMTLSFERVYWAGTALFLLADVELRRRAGVVGSVDDAVTRMCECCNASSGARSAREVVRMLDDICGEAVFTRLLDTWLASTEFPDVEPAYAWLGLARGEDGLVTFDDTAPGAGVRRAMTAPRAR